MNVITTIETLKIFLNKQINSLAMTNPVISFSKPLITRIVNNKLDQADGFLRIYFLYLPLKHNRSSYYNSSPDIALSLY